MMVAAFRQLTHAPISRERKRFTRKSDFLTEHLQYSKRAKPYPGLFHQGDPPTGVHIGVCCADCDLDLPQISRVVRTL